MNPANRGQPYTAARAPAPHFHCVVPDGVFVEASETGASEFHALPPSADAEVEPLLLRVMKRLHALFTRKGLLDEGERYAGPFGALESLQHEAARGQPGRPSARPLNSSRTDHGSSLVP